MVWDVQSWWSSFIYSFVKFYKSCFAAYSNTFVILKVVVDMWHIHALQQGRISTKKKKICKICKILFCSLFQYFCYSQGGCRRGFYACMAARYVWWKSMVKSVKVLHEHPPPSYYIPPPLHYMKEDLHFSYRTLLQEVLCCKYLVLLTWNNQAPVNFVCLEFLEGGHFSDKCIKSASQLQIVKKVWP